MRTVALLALALVALVPSLGLSEDTLAKFEGGIGVDGVSSAAGTAPTAAVVTRVLAQLEELLDIQVPAFQVRADGALALAALVDRHRGIVDHLQEWHHALRLAVGALDMRA